MLRVSIVSVVVCCIFVCGCVTVPLQTPKNNIVLGAIVDDRGHSLAIEDSTIVNHERPLRSSEAGVFHVDNKKFQRTPYYKKPFVWIGIAALVAGAVAIDTGADRQEPPPSMPVQ